nr:T9SS type A sorting domain-containing protein [Candidatus Cloacimonadota bacterium]
ETGYEKYLGYKQIRDSVRANSTRILFDYADILCYDDDSETPNTTTWSGNDYPIITTTNSLPEQTGHISNAGALRLAKAMWWMLSRIAGWDGSSPLDIDDNQNNKGYSKKIVTHDKIELHLDEHYSKWSAGLYDFQGMEIIKKTIGSDLLTFNISTLSSGIYFIVLSNGREKLVEKVIKP